MILGCLLCLTEAFSQNRISGRVVDGETGEGLPSTNVFFSGTLLGATTNKDGFFSLAGFASGKYDFTASFVGYAMYRQSYTFTGNEQVRLLIKLMPDAQQLAAVVVTATDRDRKANLALFKKLFLGEGKHARQCKIVNEGDLYFHRDPDEGMLVAHGVKPLVIENKSLGYRIQYHLVLFQYRFFSGQLDSYGTPQFEEMTPKDEAERKEWEVERANTYTGSVTHFMRSMLKSRLLEERFTVSRVLNVPNTERPPQEFLDRKIDSLKNLQKGEHARPDLVRTELFKLGMMRSLPLTVDSVLSESLQGQELVNPDTVGLVSYKGPLIVVFGGKMELTKRGDTRLSGGLQSKVHIFSKFSVYENGYFDNLGNLLFEGYWSNSEKLPMMLPLDYQVKTPER